ncbi:MAG: malate synthase A [Planctomycetota bacterium]|nr:MAG: malate synthase A [Planctomycetota bacterium]
MMNSSHAFDPLGLPEEGLQLLGPVPESSHFLLTPEALRFLAGLQRQFQGRRQELLARRLQVQRRLDQGWKPEFLESTRAVRESDWQVDPVPAPLQDRRIEITGPVDRKMVINALNSGAKVFMADFEDANSPTWANCVQGQHNLYEAVRGTLAFVQESNGKHYQLQEDRAVLMVRPRGWHLQEANVLVDGQPMSASLFDFGLFFFHNAKAQLERGAGPFFYLPKLENHLEARLWNDIFVFAQEQLDIPEGTIKATVLIETILAAFEMDEILYELRRHSAGLNCGRWDYIFSFIKKFRAHPEFVLPDRGAVTMDRHFLRSYSRLLIQTCHRRGVHAMGGMAAQIPIKENSKRNEEALEKVRLDKRREAGDGHDGTWVAHPGLIDVALQEFNQTMPGPNQLQRQLPEWKITAADLLKVPDGAITESGLRQNLNVGVLYLEAWLGGTGCVPIYHLMEDAATAEISRTQVWQWRRHQCRLDDGRLIDAALVKQCLEEELGAIRKLVGESRFQKGSFEQAAALFADLILHDDLQEFLTLPAYEQILSDAARQALQAGDAAVPQPQAQLGNQSMEQQNGESLGFETIFGPGGEMENRWLGIKRDYTLEEVKRLRGSFRIRYTLAEMGAERLWKLLHTEDYVNALGALTGNQAMQMVRAGLKSIYLSGWQVAADANLSGNMYPDQSLYPSNSAPALVKKINRTLQRADQISHMEGQDDLYWMAPIVADAEAGFGGPLNAFELMKLMIEAGAAGVHFEDQLASEKKCGHLGGKVLVPTSTFIRTLNAARLAADVMGVPTILVARTDANAAGLLTSDIDERDHPFITGERTPEGFFKVKAGLDQAISRGLAYAPYADLVWCETSEPNLAEAKRFAETMHAQYPDKLLAYNCSPSFNWKAKLDDATIEKFQRELGAMGYKYQFVTLAGFHNLNHGMFELARGYKDRGMAAYSELQQAEFASEEFGYSATRHQREVGTGYFDAVTKAVSGGKASTVALAGSTEEEQFQH